MDERSGELERAGAQISGQWDDTRVERTLRAAKRRRLRRVVVRGAVGAVCAGALVLALLPSRSPPVPVQVASSADSSRLASPDARTSVAKARVVLPAIDVVGDAGADANELAVRRNGTRIRVVSSAHKRDGSSWRELMQRGDAHGAHAILRAQRPPLRNLDDLMLAADAARRSNDAEAAVAYLEQALSRHREPRTAVVAFTLGRILRDELKRPAQAAKAFAEVETRAKDAPLSADALAREVEAWQAAGERAHASQRAKAYLTRYPTGERRAWMERLLSEP